MPAKPPKTRRAKIMAGGAPEPTTKSYGAAYPSLPARLAAIADWISPELKPLGLRLEIVETEKPSKAKTFHLTPAERRLADFLMQGGTVNGFAIAHDLSRHTVRNQLQAIFQKTGTKRQAELVLKLGQVSENS